MTQLFELMKKEKIVLIESTTFLSVNIKKVTPVYVLVVYVLFFIVIYFRRMPTSLNHSTFQNDIESS